MDPTEEKNRQRGVLVGLNSRALDEEDNASETTLE